MTKAAVIVGAGRQGRNVVDIFGAGPGPPIAGYLDDTRPPGTVVDRHPILAGFGRMADRAFVRDHVWIVALGDNVIRQALCLRLADHGADFVNAIHASAFISDFATVGRGVFINAYTRVGSGARIRDWALIEGLTWVGCDVDFGEAARCGPNCVFAGGASVGECTFVGSGGVISNEVRVGAHCVVAANAAVVRDLPDSVRAQGLPARVVLSA